MPNAMKLPSVHAALPKADRSRADRSQPDPSLMVEPVDPAPQAFSYTYGRLRPCFVTLGAWHELASMLPGGATPAPGSDELDATVVKLFGPDGQGKRPGTFYLARELVWPIVDALGTPQAVVVPESDEEIVELLANVSASPAKCAQAQSIVRGMWTGFATGLGAAFDGLPLLRLVSAFPHAFELTASPGCGDWSFEALFRAYLPLLANNGIGDEQRAVNYVLTESKAFYELASRLDERGRDQQVASRLVRMSARAVAAPRSRPQIDVVFSFGSDAGGVRHWFQRVSTGGPFPFLVTKEVLPFYLGPDGGIRPQELALVPSIGPQQLEPAEAARPSSTIVPSDITREELEWMAQAAYDINMAYFGSTNYPEKASQNTVAVIKLSKKSGDIPKGAFVCVMQRYYTASNDKANELGIEWITNPDSSDQSNLHAEQLAVQEFGGKIEGMGISKPPCGKDFANCKGLLARQGIPYAYWTSDGIVVP